MADLNVYQKIKEIIYSSDLTEEQKKEFSELFARTKERPLLPVLRLFEKDKRWVKILYDNFNEKKQAFVTGSISHWKEIIKKEKETIKSKS